MKPVVAIVEQDETSLRAEAQREDSATRELFGLVNRGWIDLGLRCHAIQKKKLYVVLGFASFVDWLNDVGIPRSTGYEWTDVIDGLKDIPPADLLKFKSKQNAKQLLKIGESRRTAEVIKAAQTMKESEFAALIQSQLVGAQVDPVEHRMLHLPASLMMVWERVIALAKRVEETDDYRVGLEAILVEYEENHKADWAEFEGGQNASE